MLLTVAAVQMSCDADRETNLKRAIELIRDAADKGANVILLPELFLEPYFCKDVDPAHLDLAQPYRGHPALARLSNLAADLGVVLPVSFFERAGATTFSAVCVIDADGGDLGLHRKAHLPDGPGRHEKYYFSPGDGGVKVWETLFCRIGVGLGWDLWFPETARSMALMGAELLVYPGVFGCEMSEGDGDACGGWRRSAQGIAASNVTPVVVANRVGVEVGALRSVAFSGGSFAADAAGEILAELSQEEEGFALARIDLEASERRRRALGVFRDRRPDIYGVLLTLDGGAQAVPAPIDGSEEDDEDMAADLIVGDAASDEDMGDADLGLDEDFDVAPEAMSPEGDAPLASAPAPLEDLDPIFNTPQRR